MSPDTILPLGRNAEIATLNHGGRDIDSEVRIEPTALSSNAMGRNQFSPFQLQRFPQYNRIPLALNVFENIARWQNSHHN